MISPNIQDINFKKFPEEIIPVIIQDIFTLKVLMLGYMNKESYKKTLEILRVTFYSRSKKKLWTKGETSGNYLIVHEILLDCDKDTLLIKVKSLGPTCHKGTDSCWKYENNKENYYFLNKLEKIILYRKKEKFKYSYINNLFKKGLNKIAQKVGEEAIEFIIESKDKNIILFLNEAADLLFHYLILLQAKNCNLKKVLKILEQRNKS